MSATLHQSNLKVLPQRATDSLELAYDSFILSLQGAHRPRRTIEYYHEKVHPFVAWLREQGATDVASITANHIRTFLLEREQAGHASLTVHHYAATIKALCNFLVGDELLATSPMRKVKMPEVEQETLPAFTLDERHRLLAATKEPRDTAVILCLLDGGCRLREFLALNAGDVDVKSGVVKEGRAKLPS